MLKHGISCISLRSFKPQSVSNISFVIQHRKNSSTHKPQPVLALQDWDLDNFRHQAFNAQIPASLPFTKHELPQACFEWFIHNSDKNHDLKKQPGSSELKPDFWSNHSTTIVPLELTSKTHDPNDENQGTTFHRSDAPLRVLLSYLGDQPSTSVPQHSIYLAQCELKSLPPELQLHIPTPDLVKYTGKGDVYSSSLWLGRPPTYTPLHRDPNPNLFLQLAGQKVIRLFTPEVGNVIFQDIQEQLVSAQRSRSGLSSASFRGEEMMQGMERRLLHRAVWGYDEDQSNCKDSLPRESEEYLPFAFEARLGLGEALFIPKGWWHSVKGFNLGITASVNWWFR